MSRANDGILVVSDASEVRSRAPGSNTGELRNRDTSVMIEKFAEVGCTVRSEFLDLNHTSKSMILVSRMISKFAPEPRDRTLANLEIGTLVR